MPNASERAAANRARKAAASTPEPEAAPEAQDQAAAEAPAEEEKAEEKAAPVVIQGGKLDLAALAKAAKAAPELPKASRAGGGEDNPFIPQIQESYQKQEARVLPPVPKEVLTSVKVAIRRAATRAGLGVSIREQEATDGTVVVSFMGKVRGTRDTA